MTIYGNNHTIDGNGKARIFQINGCNVVFHNITFTNGSADKGGAIYSEGTVTAIGCTFTGNTATSEKGGAIYNYEGSLKIVDSRFDKNSKYDRAIYNYGTEDNLFRLTIINTTMIEDKVCVNYEGNERKLDDKRDIDLLTTEVNAYIQEIIYEGAPVLISVSGIDADFTGSVAVNITNTIYNTLVDVANGEGNTTMNLDINRYTARFKNFISLTEDAFERDDTKPYLEINFKVACNNSFSALEDMISKATDNVTLSQDYIYDSKTDSAYMRISDKTLTIYGNGHSINGNTNNGDTLFLIEDDSDVRMENLTLENGHAQSRSHLGSQIRMGGAIFVSRSTLTLINSTLKNNKAEGGSGGAIYSDFSTLNIIESTFTNNNAANGKNLYVQGGNGVYILNSIIDEKDIYNEPDWDNDDILANITIFSDLNATLNISTHVQGEDALLNIIGPENFTGVANLTVDNNQIDNIQFTDGQASLNLNLNPGQYTATVSTPNTVYYNDADRNLTCIYLAANASSNQFIVKRVVSVMLGAPNITYGESQTINVNINATGNITIRLNGKNITNYTNVAYDEIDYPIGYLAAGDYTVEVIYSGNDFTGPNSNSTNFTVYKANSSLDDVDDLVFDYNGANSTVVSFTNASGVAAEVINQSNAIVDVEGNVITVSGLDAGTYTLSVTTITDENYNNITKTAKITVNKINSTITIPEVVLSYGESKNVDIDTTGAIGITAKIDGNNVSVSGFSVPVSGWGVGNHTLTVSTVVDGNHVSVTEIANILIKKADSSFDVNDLVMEYKDGSAWTVTLTDASGNAISNAVVKIGIKINGVDKVYNRKTDANGVASLPINSVSGEYAVNATFDGDDNYVGSFASATVTVNPATPILSGDDLVMEYKNGAWAVTLTDAKGNTISNAVVKIGIKINGVDKAYNRKTDANGVASLPINMAPGEYSINATFEGNSKYAAAFVNATVIVNKVSLTLSAEDLTMTYKDGSSYKVNVVDANGDAVANVKVKFTLNGKDYNSKTDENGVAKLPINFGLGNYTITATVNDAIYGSNEINNSISVTTENLAIAASDVSMTYNDGTAYEVQLVDGKGNPVALANQIIKVTVKGKTYDRKTDANGVAKLPIKLSAGIYNITAEYNGIELTNNITVVKS